MKFFFYYRFDLTKKTPPTKILWVQTVTLHLNEKFFFITDLTWPERPPCQNFMGANCNVTPQWKKFFYYRFDLTKRPPQILWVQTVTLHLNEKIFFITDLTWPKRPPPRILWMQTVMLHLNEKFFLLQIWLDQLWPPSKMLWVQTVMLHLNEKIFFITDLTWPTLTPFQNVMGANCNVTPQLKKLYIYRCSLWNFSFFWTSSR